MSASLALLLVAAVVAAVAIAGYATVKARQAEALYRYAEMRYQQQMKRVENEGRSRGRRSA